MMKILITPRSFVQSGQDALDLLRKYPLELMINETGKTLSEEQMLSMCADADGVIVGIDPMPDKVLQGAGKLKAISKYGAGLDNIVTATAETKGIKVMRAEGANAESVAELTIGLMFNIARSICPAAESVKKIGWGRKTGTEILGKTAGILGLGAVGREVARMCSGLGMNIIAYDPFFDNQEFQQKYSIRKDNMDAIFRSSDFVFLNLPLTGDTKGLINHDTLAVMKKSAFIINTARGEIVNEEDLYEALKNGVIAGAAQDVFSKEPPGEHPLLTLDNFVLTPHIGAFTKEASERTALVSAKNLIKMLIEER